MAMLTKTEVEELTKVKDEVCVSIFLSTHRGGINTQQDSVRLKQLLKKAEEEIAVGGKRVTEIHDLLAPALGLLQSHDFWQFQSDGLAIFLSPELFRHYRLPHRFDERVVVNTRFYIKPLIPVLTGDGRFLVLAISQNQVRLLQGSRFSVDEVNLDNIPGLPRSLEQALRFDQAEKQTQMHEVSRASGGRFGETAIFHGQGPGEEDLKMNIRQLFRMVDDGLHDILRNEQAPLVLAGVDYLHPLYKEVNTYPHLLDAGIMGNTEGFRPDELHARAWDIVGPRFQEPQTQALEAFRQLAGEKRERVSKNLRTIIPASFYGRVGTLFVVPAAEQWGKFDPATQDLQIHERREKGDEELYDLAVVHTFMNSGNVFACDVNQMPDHATAAAVMRY